MRELVSFYERRRAIEWRWQAIDSKACPAPLGGQDTGKSPVDRAKRGSKIHMLVDARGAPWAVYISAANTHDKWLADELILSIVVPRPNPDDVEQHLCLDKGYDYPDVHHFVEIERYVAHIKHRRRRGEPVVEECPKSVQCLVKPNSQPVAGLSSAPLAGSPSVVVCVLAGAKSLKTGWLSFSSLVHIFS